MEKRFIEFLNKSHTTYQAITEAKKILLDNNFIELDLINPWNLKKGQNYFIIKKQKSTLKMYFNHQLLFIIFLIFFKSFF